LQLAAAPRTEGANQGSQPACTGAGPTAGEPPLPPHPQRCHGQAGAKCGHARRQFNALASLECLHCNARGGRWSACWCSECAPDRKTLRTSGGQTQNECGAQGRRAATRAAAVPRGRSAGSSAWGLNTSAAQNAQVQKYQPNIRGERISGQKNIRQANISRIISLICISG
jgi:hypothetical protein